MQFVSKDLSSNLAPKMYATLSIYHLGINCIIVLDNIDTLGFGINNPGYIQLRFVVSSIPWLLSTWTISIDWFQAIKYSIMLFAWSSLFWLLFFSLILFFLWTSKNYRHLMKQAEMCVPFLLWSTNKYLPFGRLPHSILLCQQGLALNPLNVCSVQMNGLGQILFFCASGNDVSFSVFISWCLCWALYFLLWW